MNCVIYSAIVGDYDSVKPISRTLQRQLSTAGFVCRLYHTTDVEVPADSGWEPVLLNWDAYWPITPVRLARHVKINSQLFANDFDASIWIDGSFTIKAVPKLADFFNEKEICELDSSELAIGISRHRDRDCVYREAEAVKRLKKDEPIVVESQVKRYKQDGMPYNFGLAETGIIYRKQSQKLADFEKMWQSELTVGSHRDQLSLPYVCWKLKRRWIDMAETVYRNPCFEWQKHPK